MPWTGLFQEIVPFSEISVPSTQTLLSWTHDVLGLCAFCNTSNPVGFVWTELSLRPSKKPTATWLVQLAPIYSRTFTITQKRCLSVHIYDRNAPHFRKLSCSCHPSLFSLMNQTFTENSSTSILTRLLIMKRFEPSSVCKKTKHQWFAIKYLPWRHEEYQKGLKCVWISVLLCLFS